MIGTANEFCPQCHIGKLKPGEGLYLHLHGSVVVSAPGMPALICDICGFQELDREAVQHIERLLNEAGSFVSRPRSSAKRPPGDKPETHQRGG